MVPVEKKTSDAHTHARIHTRTHAHTQTDKNMCKDTHAVTATANRFATLSPLNADDA